MQKNLLFKGTLLVTDLDGTLITTKKEIPKRNVEAINRFKEEGGLFSFATGRGPAASQYFAELVKPNAPGIIFNGSAIYDFKKQDFVCTEMLPEPEGFVRDTVHKFPDVGLEIFRENDIYIVNQTERTQQHMYRQNLGYHVANMDDVPQRFQKILLAANMSRLKEVKEYFETKYKGRYHYVFSSGFFLEVLPLNVTKGSMLKKLAETLGIDISNTVGIGDYYNDMELVTEAGYGAAVEGSPEELIRNAKFVTGCYQNGAVADLIEHLEEIKKSC